VYTEARTVLKAVSSLTVGVWRSLRITVFGTNQNASAILRKTFEWKRYGISMLEENVHTDLCSVS
jgi:hypothetical protein